MVANLWFVLIFVEYYLKNIKIEARDPACKWSLGKVMFSHVSLCPQRGGGRWHEMNHGINHKAGPFHPSGYGTWVPTASPPTDIWWSSLETCSNWLSWGSTPSTLLTSNGWGGSGGGGGGRVLECCIVCVMLSGLVSNYNDHDCFCFQCAGCITSQLLLAAHFKSLSNQVLSPLVRMCMVTLVIMRRGMWRVRNQWRADL